jgi:hypothetical protein
MLKGRIRMRIATAAIGPRVWRNPAWYAAALLSAALAGCAARPNTAQRQPRALSRSRPPATQPVAATTPAPEQPEVAFVAPPAQTQPTSYASTEPSRAFEDRPGSRKAVTSNGEFDSNPSETIVVDQPEVNPLLFTFNGTYMYGSVAGHLQIPSGGKGGTTNADRPKFNGIGIVSANIGDGELAVQFAPHQEIYGGAQIIRLGGTATLQKALISHSLHFPVGAHLDSSVQLDWYRLGYRYTFVADTAQNGIPDVTLTPYVEAILWDFDYSLSASGVGKASRSFSQPGIQIGGTLAWRPNGGPFSLEASLGSFPPISHLATISTESVYARYRFYELKQLDLSALIGVAWEQQDFHDNQKVQNHVSANLGPMFIAGVQVQF